MVKKNYLANPKKMHFMSTPENLKYTKDHEWVAIDGNLATIGITHYAHHELGDIVYVDINTVGKKLAAEEIFGTVEAVKTVSDLFLPLTGTITEVNPELNNKPELVNNDPYGEGWMIKVKVDSVDEVKNLLTSEAYAAQVGS